MNRTIAWKVAGIALAAALCSACAHRQVARAHEPSGREAASPTEASRSVVANPNAEPSVRGDILRSIPELKTVYFDYDSSFLKQEARTVLASDAGWLKEHAGTRVLVTGNCDQRGTVEYNLALGQRRAAAVREYYMHLGVPGNQIATISYGKERLVCRVENESCWRRNRRAETLEALSRNVSRLPRPAAAQ